MMSNDIDERSANWRRAMIERGHTLATKDGRLDYFAYEDGNHNGPACTTCGWGTCWHCNGGNTDDIPQCRHTGDHAMTEHQPGSRKWAEAEARKGAKVRHESWIADAFVMFSGGEIVWWHGRLLRDPLDCYPGTGWSLYEPAPAQAPDLAARVAELERQVAAMERKHETRPAFVPVDPALGATPTFTTSRKPEPSEESDELVAQMKDDFLASVPDPAPVVMTDAQIIDTAIKLSFNGVAEAETVIRLTRASIRAQLAANEEGAVEAFEVEWGDLNRGPVAALSAALKAHKKGV